VSSACLSQSAHIEGRELHMSACDGSVCIPAYNPNYGKLFTTLISIIRQHGRS